MTKKISKKIDKKFKPVFSGSRPTPKVTLPSYQRQLVYLERVLNEMIDDVNSNFEKYDEYIVDKMQELIEYTEKFVEQITTEKINEDVSAAIDRELEQVLNNIDELLSRVVENEGRINDTDESLSDLSEEVTKIAELIDEVANDLQDLSEHVSSESNSIREDMKKYTDEAVENIKSEIESEQVSHDEINEIVDERLTPVNEEITAIDELSKQNQSIIGEIMDTLEDTPGVVLEKRISEVEGSLLDLDGRVGILEETSKPDLSDIYEKLDENDEAIKSLSVEFDGYKDKIEESHSVSHEALEETKRLDIKVDELSTKVDSIPEDIDGAIEDLDSSIAGLSDQVSDVNIKVQEFEAEELPKRVKEIESFMDLSSREFIEFKSGANAANNILYKVSQNDDGISVYTGKLAFDLSGEFNSIDSLVIEGLKDPLNLKNEVTGRSEYINRPIILHDDGVILDGEIEVVNEVISIHSDKLSELVENADGVIRVVVDLTLMFDGNFSVLE